VNSSVADASCASCAADGQQARSIWACAGGAKTTLMLSSANSFKSVCCLHVAICTTLLLVRVRTLAGRHWPAEIVRFSCLLTLPIQPNCRSILLQRRCFGLIKDGQSILFSVFRGQKLAVSADEILRIVSTTVYSK